MKRNFRFGFSLGMVVIVTACAVGWAQAQQANGVTASVTATATPPAQAPVQVNGRTLFQVSGDSKNTAGERADQINLRLTSLVARNEPVRPFTKQDLLARKNETLITLGGQPIMSVTDADAAEMLTTRQELALDWGHRMASAVADARATRANPLKGAGILIRNSFNDLIVSLIQWLPRLAGAVILWILFWLLARAIRWVVKLVMSPWHIDTNLRQLARAIAFYGTWVIGLIAILSTLGLQGSSIATTLGISGFVLGFAFKDILSHFFAGLMLLTGRQFHIGDQIVVGNYEGTVERIELRALYLRTYDNRLVIIPNGDVFTSAVTSNTASPVRRRELVIGIDYENDIAKAQRVALETMQQVKGIASDPAPDVLVDELTASTVNLRLRFFANSLRADYLKVGSECMRRVKEAFQKANIALPSGDVQTISIENLPKTRNAPAGERAAPADGKAPDDGKGQGGHTRRERQPAD